MEVYYPERVEHRWSPSGNYRRRPNRGEQVGEVRLIERERLSQQE